jgi:hypothetical protein
MFGTSNRAEAKLTLISVCALIKLDTRRNKIKNSFLNMRAIY